MEGAGPGLRYQERPRAARSPEPAPKPFPGGRDRATPLSPLGPGGAEPTLAVTRHALGARGSGTGPAAFPSRALGIYSKVKEKCQGERLAKHQAPLPGPRSRSPSPPLLPALCPPPLPTCSPLPLSNPRRSRWRGRRRTGPCTHESRYLGSPSSRVSPISAAWARAVPTGKGWQWSPGWVTSRRPLPAARGVGGEAGDGDPGL